MTMAGLLYIDAFAGLSGDMFLGGLIGLGVPEKIFSDLPGRLGFEGTRIEFETVKRKGLAAHKVNIHFPQEKKHRHLSDIQEILEKSDLDRHVVEASLASFKLLADAEARVHGTTPDKIHFHEVGAVDSILDIVGTHQGVAHLGVERVLCSPLPLSRGMATMAHGLMPFPAPATVELLRGCPTCPVDLPFESVTPTGACLAVSLARFCESWPAMSIRMVGLGAGSKEGGLMPNVVRLILAEESQPVLKDSVWVLECEVDDMNPEFFEPLWCSAFDKGALDLFITPIQMKKGRPGALITLLCHDLHREECEQLLLQHTSTYGVRRSCCERTTLKREIVEVDTVYGCVPIKTVPGMGQKAAPEASVVRKLAEQAGVSMSVVYWEAMKQFGGKQ